MPGTLARVMSSCAEPSDAERFRAQQDDLMKMLSASLPPLQDAASKLLALCDQAERALGARNPAGTPADAFDAFCHVLAEARRRADDVPTGEHDALAKAADYYRQAYETGSQVGEGLAQVQTAFLIAELSRRARDFKTAEQDFNTVLKLGWEVGRGGNADVATVNQTNKLLETARELARVNKEEQTS